MEKILRHNSGFTLLELLISITLMGIMIVGLEQVLQTAISAYDKTREKQELLIQARFAMDRIVRFVQETDHIELPSSDAVTDELKVTERATDTYNNSTHAYTAGGDGKPDADNDGNGLINDGGVNDPPDYIRFFLDDTTDANNWKLQEKMPDYSTADPNDFKSAQVLCEYVSAFQITRLALNLVEIELTLEKNGNRVALKTRARARLIE